MNSSRQKLLVFSLDGVGPGLLERLKNEGAIPFISQMMGQGASGELASTDPPLTPTSWMSIFSGLRPARHGIWDFIRHEGGGKFRVMNRSYFDGELLWEYASRNGKKVAVLNQPVSYPLPQVNGVIVADHLFTPRKEKNIAYPPGFIAEIEGKLGPYKLFNEGSYHDSRASALLEDCKKEVSYKHKVFDHINETIDWDLFIFYLWGPDYLQHTVMHFMDATHPQYDEKKARKVYPQILDYFKCMDSHLQEIHRNTSENTTTLFLSDHGFQPLHQMLHPNTWLLQNGYIKLKDGMKVKFKKLLFDLGFTPENIFNLLNRFFTIEEQMPMVNTKLGTLVPKTFLSFMDVDMKRTLFYAKGNFGQLYVNPLRGGTDMLDHQQALTILTNALHGLKDPSTGEAIIEKVLLKGDLHTTGSDHTAPDALFYTKGYRYKSLGALDFNSNKIASKPIGFTGHHDHSGIFICSGPGIKPASNLSDLHGYDVFPTAARLLGLPVPEGLDGKAINAIFNQPTDFSGSAAATPLDSKMAAHREQIIYSDEDEQEIEKRLKDLGYL